MAKPTTSNGSIFKDCTEETLNIGSTDVESRYFELAGVRGTQGKFIVTQQFKDLKSLLIGARSNETVVLNGPKGVGKSATLGALATLCRRPCILFSLQVHPTSAIFCEYLTALYNKYQTSHTPPAKSARLGEPVNANAVVTFLRDFNNPVLLCDISGWTKQSEEVLELAGAALMQCSTYPCTTVVAHSSGTGNFPMAKRVFRNYIQKLVRCRSENLLPFTDAEADVFMDTFKTEFTALLPVKERLKALTNYNPSLLIDCFNKKSFDFARAAVQRHVRSHIDGVRTSLQGDRFHWVQKNILFSMEMMYYAENEIMVGQDRLMAYLTCWVAAENLTYIVRTSADGFWLRVNYPPVYSVLMDMFNALKPQNIETVNAIVKGYQFENKFLHEVCQLELVYNEQDSQAKKFSTFEIKVTKQLLPGEPLTNMTEGVLYHLREKHPVIDAVGKFKEAKGQKVWLLMVQVSLSSYTQHRSKAANLLDRVTGPEPTTTNWLEYYSHLGGTTPKEACMYVYISPDEIEQEGQLPSHTLAETGQRSRTKDLFLGLVANRSETAKTITTVVAQL